MSTPTAIEHMLAVVAAAAGAVVASRPLPRQALAAIAETLRFAERHAAGAAPGRSRGPVSYGAGLARFLAEPRRDSARGQPPPRAERRLRGKDDALDAIRTARAALASQTLALPRSG